MISTALAQITNPSIGDLTDRVGEGGTSFLGDFLSLTITILLIVGGLYFFFQLITGGVAWIGSGGDKGKLEEARGKVLNAGLGLVLLFSAFAIITLIENIFGVGILRFDIPIIGQSSSIGDGGGGGRSFYCVGSANPAVCPASCPYSIRCKCNPDGSCTVAPSP